MAGGMADERQILVDLAVRQSPPRLHPPQEMVSLPIPEELLPDIFLRLPDPADLVRASAACVSFRRLVADRYFLRQYRRLHAPPFLGFLVDRNFFQPAVAPHPSAPAASAVALAADFSFAFLPSPSNWLIQDVRDGRVLLYKLRRKEDFTFAFIDLVVCDPLQRRYLLLPPFPDEVFTSAEKWHTFLAPPADSGDKEEAVEETAFTVIWIARRGDNLVTLVFLASTGQWQAGPSHSWGDSFSGLLSQTWEVTLSLPHYAYGCFYWVTDCREMLLVLDTRRMEFSITDAPPQAKGSHYIHTAIVEAGEGRPGMFVLPDDTLDLNFIIRQWKLEKTISLDFRYYFVGSTGRQLFLENNEAFFSFNMKTFQLKAVSVSASEYKNNMFWPCAYSNFPPSLLSSPTVASGVEIGTETETLEQGGTASSSA